MEYIIRNLITAVQSGILRVPTFQRGFVWDAEKVAYLMDSIYKGYPIGSLLIWRTQEQLEYDRKLGPFQLPNPTKNYPIDYILDGQQRVTSIFGVFQTDIERDGKNTEDWMDIYFDLDAKSDAQESQFIALTANQVDLDRYFPLKLLFNVKDFGRAMRGLSEELADRMYEVQSKFTAARIPAELLETEDKTTVAIVFERANRRSVPLDTLQLLSAWTWNKEFDLQKGFESLADDLENFGFREVGEESNLMLRCCSAVLAHSASTDALMKLNGAVVRSRFQEVENGIKGAVDFLRRTFHVYSLDNLPSTAILIPLSVFFSSTANKQVRTTHSQNQAIMHWFWRTCFNRRYNSQPAKTIQTDIDEMVNLKIGKHSNLTNFTFNHSTPYLFITEQFRINNALAKTFVLLLAQKHPLSFISGVPISLATTLKSYNKNEFHHLNPKAFIRTQPSTVYNVNCLANISFMSRADNNTLGGDAPSIYKEEMPKDDSVRAKILEHSFCSNTLFNDNFVEFIEERAALLAAEANRLMG
jgi:hypothetical protein